MGFCKGNYLNYLSTQKTKLAVAKETITTLIEANPQIDFGLAVFNEWRESGYPYGGYILEGLRERTDTSRLVETINGINANTATPLCDTYYEVYRYLTGRDVYFGSLEDKRDKEAEVDSTYRTPVKNCQNIYVIYMTDGEPTEDGHSNSRIERLTGKSCKGNCLPTLAEYMANFSKGSGGLDGDNTTGDQKAFTYTIGFNTDQPLLFETARKGKGRCYTTSGGSTSAETGCVRVDNLTAAFQGALGEIMKRTSTFVSPSVAVNSFNRTESVDDVYYAMFLPDDSSLWSGNLKKLKIYKGNSTPGCTSSTPHTSGTVVDKNCNIAFSKSSNEIIGERQTYWSSTYDGNTVKEGGLGETLLTARGTFYTNLTNDKGAEYLGPLSNIPNARFGTGTDNTQAQKLKNWIQGRDDSGNVRGWVLGDILHSKPITLNYGDSDGNPTGGDYSITNPNIRIAFGTNHGLLHFIEDKGSTVEENWSFFVGETAGNVQHLYENRDDVAHPYGLDGQISVIRIDANKDGNIREDDGDRMVLFFGLRRGGDSYYAIDVTNPESPSLLWRIDRSSPGFAELGQSWSAPTPLILPGHRTVTTSSDDVTTIKYKYALAFGAGYDDINDDDRAGEARTGGGDAKQRKRSNKGRGLFIVDAGTGQLVQSFTAPDDVVEPVTKQMESGLLNWSVVASPAILDSNNDGLTDRIYFADTGGNLFRVDIGKAYLNDADKREESAVWSLIQLAQLGADEPENRPMTGQAGDRRFMYQPELVRTIFRGIPYDAVVLGSGDRAHPLNESNTDRFYMIRDTHLLYKRFGSCDSCVTPPAVIKHNNLYDASANLIQTGTAAQSQGALSLLDASKGWFIDLEATGEKTNTVGKVYDGQLLFSTFSPARDAAINICTPGVGSSRYYVVNLQTAGALRDVDRDGVTDERFSLRQVVGMAGDPIVISLGKGNDLIDLSTGHGISNLVGIHRNGWVEQ